MTGRLRLSVLLLAAALAACTGPGARISRHKDAFNAYPPDVQAAIKDGRVQVGMTPDMVLMAAGDPDRKWTSDTQQGSLETWVWYESQPGVGVGFGVSSGYGHWGRGVGTSVGVGVGGAPAAVGEKRRVVFQDGRVVSVDQAKTSS